MTFLEGFTVTAMPVTIDSKEYANKMAKGLNSISYQMIKPEFKVLKR